MNAFVADDCHCSPSLSLQQANKLVDATWKAADHVLILKYTLLFSRPQTPVFWHQKKSEICVQMGEGVTPMSRHYVQRISANL